MIYPDLGIVNEATGLATSLIDRWVAGKRARLNAKALVRLLRLEARRNLAILDVAIRYRRPRFGTPVVGGCDLASG